MDENGQMGSRRHVPNKNLRVDSAERSYKSRSRSISGKKIVIRNGPQPAQVVDNIDSNRLNVSQKLNFNEPSITQNPQNTTKITSGRTISSKISTQGHTYKPVNTSQK
jgi:hypothetical protein